MIPKDKQRFVDESGIEDNVCKEYGWSMRGSRNYSRKIYQHKRRIN